MKAPRVIIAVLLLLVAVALVVSGPVVGAGARALNASLTPVSVPPGSIQPITDCTTILSLNTTPTPTVSCASPTSTSTPAVQTFGLTNPISPQGADGFTYCNPGTITDLGVNVRVVNSTPQTGVSVHCQPFTATPVTSTATPAPPTATPTP